MTVVRLPRAHWDWRLRYEGIRWRATGPGFVDLTKSPAGIGATPQAAILNLARRRRVDVPPRTFLNDRSAHWTRVVGEVAFDVSS